MHSSQRKQMTIRSILFTAAIMVLAITSRLWAIVPSQISHQGVVSVNGVRFNGDGTFYFALVSNNGSGINLWTNDGSQLGETNRPTAGVVLSVTDGVYAANLGGGTMTPMEPGIFNNANLVLRIWLDDGANGVQQLSPDQALSASPFAMQAERVGGWLASELVPPGTIIAYGGATMPPGWLPCDGSEVSRLAYPVLFSAIDTAWGAGNLSTTFHLPDLRGRFLRGMDGGSGRDPDVGTRTASNAGGLAGNAVGSVQADAFQGHHHGLNHSNLTAWGWGEPSNGFNNIGGGGGHGFFNNWRVMDPDMDFSGNGAPRFTKETRPANAYVKYIIKY